jgi:mannose-6-phosphate isomerase
MGPFAPFFLQERKAETMRREPIFLNPVFKERIWGGTALQEKFGYDIPSSQTGECWAISAHPHGQSVVREGEYAGLTLGELWVQHRELFGNAHGDTFPLLTKILDANADLSVQVHPDDDYAWIHENGEMGKTECWYIIDCKEGAELIYGHTAQSKDQLQEMIQNGEWDRLLRKIKIKPGDFFYVPSGTIHALGAGTLVLETQQSSDTTYRVYDYDRKDEKGNSRELHIEKAIDVTKVPHIDPEYKPNVISFDRVKVTNFIKEKYFTVQKWEIYGPCSFEQDQDFMLASVVDGTGQMICEAGTYRFQMGDHFILPSGFGRFQVNGQVKLIVSHP